MKKSTVIAFSAAMSLMMTGCESPKPDVVAKKYVLIVHNVSYWGCSNVAMGVFTSNYGIDPKTVNYHQDPDNGINCADYTHELDKTCWEESLEKGKSGYGEDACAIGIDEPDEPNTENEAEVKKQKYVAIIPHVSSLACTKGGIDKVIEDHNDGNSNIQYEFTQEKADVTCAKNFPEVTECKEFNGLEEGAAGYSEKFACVIGTQAKELKDN